MRKDKIFNIFAVGEICYFFIESFYNLMINVNAYVFMNLSEILSILPVLAITILSLIILMISFNKKKIISHKYKIFLIILLISAIRIITLFIFLSSVQLIFNFILLFSCMIFFKEVIFMTQMDDKRFEIIDFLTGMIFGIILQLILLIITYSSNLAFTPSKFIPIILIIITLNLINIKEFLPKKLDSLSFNKDKKREKREISLIHFVILGIIFLLSVIWIFNPMALSAYGIINLNFLNTELTFPWFSYGFNYYILIIIITTLLSFYLTNRFVLKLEKKRIRLFSIIFGAIFVIVNLLTLTYLEINKTVQNSNILILSTFLLTFSTIVNVSFLIYYLMYIFTTYSFHSRSKLFKGLFTFFITILVFIILQVQVLWYSYVSLIINVVLLLTTGGILIFFIEGFNFSKLSMGRILSKKVDLTSFSILWKFIFILLIISFGIVLYEEKEVSPGNVNPTFMTWNIHNAIGVDDNFNLDRLIEEVKKVDPDILGLNEVDMGALKTSFIDIGSYFAEKLNLYYFYGYTFYKHYGNVLLSKYPILEADIIPLPLIVKSAEPRSMIKATIGINNSYWNIYITHLSTKSQDRLAQVPFIINKINEDPFDNVVWMGDFNFEPTDTEYSLINSTVPTLNFTDTFTYLNYPDPGYTGDFDENYQPQKRIDYIMCSPDLMPVSSEVLCSYASDHCAVITEF
ncbi:MAG: hypothetical protein GF317_07050 [Candidatus Lokiarchaeota archaeon]|nr:hypothetical protein [Candidatus Lokiarchaeota archaeon]MBD3199465.1 hypothetical protein [Candidatus Lokiarchaeota archaeon]